MRSLPLPATAHRLLITLLGVCGAVWLAAPSAAAPPAGSGQKTITVPVNLAVKKDCKVVSGDGDADLDDFFVGVNVTLPSGQFKSSYFLSLGTASVRCTKGTAVSLAPGSGSVPLSEYTGPHGEDDRDHRRSVTLYYWIASPGTMPATGFSSAACPPAAALATATTVNSSSSVNFPVAGCVPAKSSSDGGKFAALVPIGQVKF